MKNIIKIFFILFLILFLCGCSPKKEIVYTTIYPSLPQLQSPNVLTLKPCQWMYSEIDDNVFIAMDENNFKCYLKNKEIIREQLYLYEKLINEINNERIKWNELNSSK